VVGNLADESRAIRVRLDRPTFGVGKGSGVRSAISRTSEAIGFDGDELTVIVPTRNFRLVIVGETLGPVEFENERSSD
jgi:hypothetical protein